MTTNYDIATQKELEEKIFQEIKGKIRELYILSAETIYIETHIELVSIDFRFSIIIEPLEQHQKSIIKSQQNNKIKITIRPHIYGSIRFSETISEMKTNNTIWPQQLSELLLSIYKIGYKHSKGKTVFMEYEFTTFKHTNSRGHTKTYNVGMFPPGFDDVCKSASCDMTIYNGHQCVRAAKEKEE